MVGILYHLKFLIVKQVHQTVWSSEIIGRPTTRANTKLPELWWLPSLRKEENHLQYSHLVCLIQYVGLTIPVQTSMKYQVDCCGTSYQK